MGHYDRPGALCGWQKTAEIINSFNPDEVAFGGSELWKKQDGKYGLCVGITFEELKDLVSNPQLDFDICDVFE